MHILAATDFSTRSNRALRQAALLVQGDAQLHVVHVVDDDQPEQMVLMERREAARVLGEQVQSMPELRHVTKIHQKVVTGDAFDGILRVAAEVQADLIVMGSHRKHLLLEIFTGTTIERVIRKGTFPVLMVNFEAQRRYENIVAAIDMSNVSAHALQVALSTGLIGGQRATLLHAFSALAKGTIVFAGADQTSIDRHVASERQRTIAELAAFLATNDLTHERWSFRVEEGEPLETISRAVSEMHPDLLVMGTYGRSGFLKALTGSVTEEALRLLNVDILVVPSAKG